MEEKIKKLTDLIEEFNDEQRRLVEMRHQWEDHDDPTSDPGLQFEQECRVEKAFKNVVEYAKSL